MCSSHRAWSPQYEGLLRWHQACLYTLGLLISGQTWLLRFCDLYTQGPFWYSEHFALDFEWNVRLNFIFWVWRVGCTAALSLPPSKQCCLRSSLVRNSLSGLEAQRAQRKVYLANELAVVRETLPALGGQREILHGDLEGIFSVSQRGWTMTSLGHSPIRRITRCVQSGADAEVARVRTRFRRFVLRVCVYMCVVHSCVASWD